MLMNFEGITLSERSQIQKFHRGTKLISDCQGLGGLTA